MLLCPWDFPGKSTGVGCHFLLQRIFLTQGSNPGLPHCRQTLYPLSHQGSQINISYYIFISCQSEWLLSKNLQTINAGKGVEKRESSYTVRGNANQYSHYGEQCGDSLKNWKQNCHQFSRSVMSDSLRPHELQHARPPCPSPTPGVHSDSHPSSQ